MAHTSIDGHKVTTSQWYWIPEEVQSMKSMYL